MPNEQLLEVKDSFIKGKSTAHLVEPEILIFFSQESQFKQRIRGFDRSIRSRIFQLYMRTWINMGNQTKKTMQPYRSLLYDDMGDDNHELS